MRKAASHFFRSIGAGLFVLLPVLISFLIVVWLAGFIHAYSGPGSMIGRLLSSIGLVFVTDEITAYFVGIIAIVSLCYFVGRIAASRLRARLTRFLDNTVGRIPLLGNVYGLTNRFVGLLDRGDQAGMESMSPVWCHFGNKAGTAVLALMPTAEPVTIGDLKYRVVLIPTAPVPFGGGLIFVPEAWVRPADIGIDGLTSIYVSMGATAPQYTGQG